MSEIIAKVASLDGTFYVKAADGSLHELQKGDEIHTGETVVGADQNTALNSIIVSMSDGTDIVMLANEQQLFDQSLLNQPFSKDETLTNEDSIEQMLSDTMDMINETMEDDLNDSDDFDDIETEAGEENIQTDTDVTQDFQEINNSSEDINANLRDVEVRDYNSFTSNMSDETTNQTYTQQEDEIKIEASVSNTPEENILKEDTKAETTTKDTITTETPVDYEQIKLHEEVLNQEENVSKLIIEADNASNIANIAAQNADAAAINATNSPTPENLAAAETAQNIANNAAHDANNAANKLSIALDNLNEAATAANENINTSTANEAIANANNAANTAINSANISELTTDSIIADRLAAANEAADAANAAVNAAQEAADTLAANTNPSAEDIAAANDAVVAANEAVTAANSAANDYSQAATAAGESVEDTTGVGSTNDAATTITDAVNAENASDAEINILNDNINDLTSNANTASDAANIAAQAANEAAIIANTNPTPENLAIAESTQSAANEASLVATTAAENLSTAVNNLNNVANTAGENIDTSAADKAIANANNSATTAKEMSEINDRISNLNDSDNNQNIIDENVEDGTYTGITLDAVDIDGDTITYSLDDGIPFRVEDNGQVVVDGDNSIDFENSQNYTFNATATSSDGTTSTQTVSIDVNDIDDTAKAPTLEVDISEPREILGDTIVDTEAMIKAGYTQNNDGNWQETYQEEHTHETDIINYKAMAEDGYEWVSDSTNTKIDTFKLGTFGHDHASISDWGTLTTQESHNNNSSNVGMSMNNMGMKNQSTNNHGNENHHDWFKFGSNNDNSEVITSTNPDGITVKITNTDGDFGVYDRANHNIGVGIGTNDSKGIDKSETMSFEISGGDANKVDFTLSGLGSYFEENNDHATQVLLTAYDQDGKIIETQGGYRESGSYEDVYSFESETPIGRVEVTSEGSNGNYVVKNMTLSSTEDIKIPGHFVNNAGETVEPDIIYQTETYTTDEIRDVSAENMIFTNEPSTYEYDISVDAALTDTDGSETLSDNVTLDIPEGVTLQDSNGNTLTPNNDGSYSIPIDENGAATVTTVTDHLLSKNELGNVSAEVTSTESSTGDTTTTVTTDTDIDTDFTNTVDVTESTYDNIDDAAQNNQREVQGSDNADGMYSAYNTNESVHIEGNGGGDNIATGSGNDYVDGGEGADNISTFGGNDYIDGGEGADNISAGNGDDTIVYDSNDSINGGNGNDTLLISEDENIDISNLADTVSNIESINLDNGSQNISNISLEDVVNVTDNSNTLRIDGDSTDSISLNTEGEDATWTLGGFKTETETGSTYQEATGSEGDATVTLEINTEIQIDQN